ncbi:ATP-binding domain-containing protein [Pseudomonas sp. GD03651]|jgi:superfamily I DNA/RNA helicase|uniref:ATP-binding domain-containing protein n=1 Tax=Pseudomonas TaxID=286 RepID=UPI00034EE8BD|nr:MULTISPECIES: ATP-binding domain-containing protein [Pseudomonas]HDS1814070.1 ATP-binding domain-containing protein [Pseudomonas putida]AGN81938.1 hypothetical protein L483_12435 [Pseudomonas putida H8234]MDH0618891.1 ATP-binding domain-containing protein [Pseudomonas fulva]MDH2187321.1 ATP-binding domain-containing protein [Pseudomonas sp. GD03651]HDS3810418.1 ATP-binding domain-containing protein [Pseudomonas putida]
MPSTWWRDASELVKEQSDLLDIDPDQRLLISGPPGSGKTNLLLLRANQLYLGAHPNLYVVVFGSLLKSFIQMGGTQYKFPSENVVTHASLFNMILRREGIEVNDSALGLMEARQHRANHLEDLINAGKIGAQFDALLLDEAQDYTPQEIRIFSQLTNVLVATADVRQKIYDVADCSAVLANAIGQEYKLKYHFRNGHDICKVADGIYKGYPVYEPMLPTSNYREADYPSEALPKYPLQFPDQIAEMIAQVRRQRVAYPEDLIGILTPRNEELDIIEAELNRAGLGAYCTRANASNRFDYTRPIWLSTLAAAKGLEFRAVHILGIGHLQRMPKVAMRLIFTGVTRAKTALTLYWHRTAPGYLKSACLPLEAPKPAPERNQIFGI